MSSLARQAKERWWIWSIPLILVLVLLGFLGNFLMALSGQGKSLLANVDRTEIVLQGLVDQSAELESQINAMRANQVLIDELYNERLSTESQRLTRILSEVKELATQAGLKPAAVVYSDETLDDYDLTRKAFSFSVEGNYAQLRRLIHLLEGSASFLTLDQIGLSQSTGGRQIVRINLRLSTLFAAGERS